MDHCLFYTCPDSSLRLPADTITKPRSLTTGACIQITGEWKASPGPQQRVQAKELHYHSLKLLGPSDPEVILYLLHFCMCSLSCHVFVYETVLRDFITTLYLISPSC